MSQYSIESPDVRRSNLKSICGPNRLRNQLNFSLLIRTMLAVFVQELFFMECQFQIHEAQHENQYEIIQLINNLRRNLVDGSLKGQELREKR